jgi:TPP-dependent pyruvate/acetoin dehydrogenase alpha subunit
MNNPKASLKISDSLLIHFYQTMVRIRNFEQAARRLYMEGRLPGFMHMSVGQEATPTGVCGALRIDDYITTTHRGHGDVIAKGVSFDAAMAELFAKSTGICKGKGGSMHIADVSKGILGANGIVGAGIPIAVGAAFSARYRKTDQVAVSFFGDGASAGGPLHESMNMAALWKLPLIFVRQNNQYAESTPQVDFQGIPDIVKWAEGYGMPAKCVDGNNVMAVYQAAQKAVMRARKGEGPSFIESLTYRWYGHNMGDPGSWRPQAEIEAWKAKDPIEQFRRYLLENQLLAESKLDEIKAKEEEMTAEAIRKAELAEPPALSSVFDCVYVDAKLGQMAIRGDRK